MKHWATWLNSRERKKALHLCATEQPLLTDGETVAVFLIACLFWPTFTL